MREREQPTTYDTLKKTLTLLAPTIATAFLAFTAFDIQTRKEIGQRDKWTCQHEGCDRDFRSGYMVTAAHFPHKHQYTGRGYHDNNPKNGRILCQLHHALEELDRGNPRGAQLVLNTGIYTHEYEDSNGGNLFLTLRDLQDFEEAELLDRTKIHPPAEQLAFSI